MAPVNLAAPTVSGTALVGQTVSASTGAWSGTPSPAYAYQWLRCAHACTPIPGAVSSRYTVNLANVGDKVAVAVTATNSAGHAVAVSPQLGPILTATVAQIRALLTQAVAVAGKPARIEQLLKHDGYTLTVTAPSSGRLSVRWYEVPKGARLSRRRKPKPVLAAAATVVFHAAGEHKIKLVLTSRGRQLLKTTPGALRLTDKATFKPTGQTAISTTKAIHLKHGHFAPHGKSNAIVKARAGSSGRAVSPRRA